jgi:hypothetical protein
MLRSLQDYGKCFHVGAKITERNPFPAFPVITGLGLPKLRLEETSFLGLTPMLDLGFCSWGHDFLLLLRPCFGVNEAARSLSQPRSGERQQHVMFTWWQFYAGTLSVSFCF